MNDQKTRRRQIFLRNGLQGRLVTRLAIAWTAYHLLLFHGMFLVACLENTIPGVNIESQVSWIDQYALFSWQNRLLIFGAFAGAPILIWDLIRSTHHVAGPLVRLENMLMRMARGESIREIKFREGDWLVSLERALNLYLESRATHVTTAPEAAVAAQADVTPIAEVPAEPRVLAHGDHDLNELLRELRDINETLSALSVGHSDDLTEAREFGTGLDRNPRF